MFGEVAGVSFQLLIMTDLVHEIYKIIFQKPYGFMAISEYFILTCKKRKYWVYHMVYGI